MDAGERSGSGIAETAMALLSTHPVNSKRISKIKEWVREERSRVASRSLRPISSQWVQRVRAFHESCALGILNIDEPWLFTHTFN